MQSYQVKPRVTLPVKLEKGHYIWCFLLLTGPLEGVEETFIKSYWRAIPDVTEKQLSYFRAIARKYFLPGSDGVYPL